MTLGSTLLAIGLDGMRWGTETRRFKNWLEGVQRPIRLVYVSYQSFEEIQLLISRCRLPAPSAVVALWGTEIRNYPSGDRFLDWHARWWADWDAAKVRRLVSVLPGVKLRAAHASLELLVGCEMDDADFLRVQALRCHLMEHWIRGEVIAPGGGTIEIVPAGADFGTATVFLARHWSVPRSQVLVCGQTSNDIKLFLHGFRGIIVANANANLKRLAGRNAYLSTEPNLDGLIDGAEHWLAPAATEQDRRWVPTGRRA